MARATRILFLLMVATQLVPAQAAEPAQPASTAAPKNIVFLLGDGMGAAQIKAYRAFADDPSTAEVEPLLFDRFQVGAIATESIALNCDEVGENCVRNPFGVTDSAASATAYATGVDTLINRLGMDLQGNKLTSILEMAARAGMGTGVVSTSQVTHASPAAFVAHVELRSEYAAIADQYFDNQVNGKPLAQLILGGGVRDFRREDRDVAAQLGEAGYALVDNRTDLAAADSLPLLGLFAPVGLPRHWDRPPETPSLSDMTRKALELLARNEKGFFLFIEGSQIDWAGHGNDIVGVISEMEGFHEAVRDVLDFAQSGGETLVLITADHETGGMSLGRDGIYEWNPTIMRDMDSTPAAMTERFLKDGRGPLSATVAQMVPFALTAQERDLLDAAERESGAVFDAITNLMNERTHTGWSTDGHTGVDVPLFATGPGSTPFRGVLQNETLGKLMIEALQQCDRTGTPTCNTAGR